MRKLKLNLLLITAILVARPLLADEVVSSSQPGWKLVWSDEFDGESLDRSKWNIGDEAPVKNMELEAYSPDKTYLKEGHLILKSTDEPYRGRRYSSGLVDTKGKFSQTYGRFEARARLPKGQGIWPAIWMLPQDGSWPPEIDIVELLGHEPNTIHCTVHWEKFGKHEEAGTPVKGPDFTKGLHVYAVEWEKDSIRWFIDGQEVFSVQKNVPEKPFYLILNTAVGGLWPGNPDSTTKFPQYHVIDYVRVYEQDK